ncbi:hypothetical protein METP2_03536 [Methanosarcinales archaeon]|nr:hypothetical protein METP2_03536 [Methanosarcinales archaeon]
MGDKIIRDFIYNFAKLLIIFWINSKTTESPEDTEKKQPLSVNSVSSVVDFLGNELFKLKV